MKILVTGGAGYIGTHTILELIKKQNKIIVIDNLSNSSMESIKRIEKITGKKIIFYKADLREKDSIIEVFKNNNIDAVIHFAGMKSLSESIVKKNIYFENNVIGSKNLFDCMGNFNVKKIVFSSTAAVYGSHNSPPYKEDMIDLQLKNPYAENKLTIENMLKEIHEKDSEWSAINLRYFNPIGADSSGHFGEDPKRFIGNLIPSISLVAAGKLEKVYVYGNNYPTHDGTGIRDYIHITDLAMGHISALGKAVSNLGVMDINLGTGIGHSVLDVIKAFEEA